MLANSTQGVVILVVRRQICRTVMLFVEERLGGNIFGGNGADPTDSVFLRVGHDEDTTGNNRHAEVGTQLTGYMAGGRFQVQ